MSSLSDARSDCSRVGVFFSTLPIDDPRVGSSEARFGPTKGDVLIHRIALNSFLGVAAVALGVSSFAAASAFATGSRSSAPPSTLFNPGYNVCDAASLPGVQKAGGQSYQKGVFDSRVCNWETSGLKAGITLSLITGAQAVAAKAQISAVHGSTVTHGLTLTSVSVPGASVSIVETLPVAVKGEVSKALLASYPEGIVHVNMTAPGSLPNSSLLAVTRAVTGA
jgi:hypothetical protein